MMKPHVSKETWGFLVGQNKYRVLYVCAFKCVVVLFVIKKNPDTPPAFVKNEYGNVGEKHSQRKF